MALSESLLLLTGICFWKNTYVFPRKHVRVFCKSRMCFLDKVMAFLMYWLSVFFLSVLMIAVISGLQWAL